MNVKVGSIQLMQFSHCKKLKFGYVKAESIFYKFTSCMFTIVMFYNEWAPSDAWLPETLLRLKLAKLNDPKIISSL